jgi:hypothetical protein
MTTKGLTAIGLYPEDRDCPAPSAARILDIFAGLSRHHLYQNRRLVQVFDPQLDTRQRAVLRLLGIRPTAYNTTSDPHPHPDHLEHPPPSHQPETRRAGHLPRPPPHHLPHALGWKNGSTKAFVYQTAILDHPSPAPRGWRSLFVDEIRDPHITDDQWHTAANYDPNTTGIDTLAAAIT